VIKFAPEGYPFIFVSLLVSVVASVFLVWSSKSGSAGVYYVSLIAACFFIGLTFFMAFFFRDPDRKIPSEEGLFVSPADGKVILVRDVHEKDYLKSDTKEISIFMSPLDVHINRAPCEGEVSLVKHTPGKFLAAYREDSSMKNENIVMVLDCGSGGVLVRQVAGFLARRAVCRVGVGDTLGRGERYGMIKFGSRLDVYLPKDAEVTVKLGDRVKAGETVIGKTVISKS
jgi:phosphatidylserine decarboxylase